MNALTVEEAGERVVDQAAEVRFVLIDEASHGTHEFYALRAELTKRLIEERGFVAVAAEADWARRLPRELLLARRRRRRGRQ
jgi:erythromycin esterase-like protein